MTDVLHRETCSLIHQMKYNTYTKEVYWREVVPNSRLQIEGRYGHSSVRIKHIWYHIGGSTTNGKLLNDVITYNLKTHEWKQLDIASSPPEPIKFHDVFAVDDNDIFIFGGISMKEKRDHMVYRLRIREKIWEPILIIGDTLPKQIYGVKCHYMGMAKLDNPEERNRFGFSYDGLYHHVYTFGGSSNETFATSLHHLVIPIVGQFQRYSFPLSLLKTLQDTQRMYQIDPMNFSDCTISFEDPPLTVIRFK